MKNNITCTPVYLMSCNQNLNQFLHVLPYDAARAVKKYPADHITLSRDITAVILELIVINYYIILQYCCKEI